MQISPGMSYFPVRCLDHTNRMYYVYHFLYSLNPDHRNPKLYHGVAKYLSLSPSKCAMVAAHTFDLRGAAGCGYKTVYVRRETEDNAEFRKNVKCKEEGGEVDVVVNNLSELVAILEGRLSS